MGQNASLRSHRGHSAPTGLDEFGTSRIFGVLSTTKSCFVPNSNQVESISVFCIARTAKNSISLGVITSHLRLRSKRSAFEYNITKQNHWETLVELGQRCLSTECVLLLFFTLTSCGQQFSLKLISSNVYLTACALQHDPVSCASVKAIFSPSYQSLEW